MKELPVGVVLGATEVTVEDLDETEADAVDPADIDPESGREPVKKAETMVLPALEYVPSFSFK